MYKRVLAKLRYRWTLYAARTWGDPALCELAERYGSVIVTAERHGKVVLPIYQAIWDGDLVGRLAHRVRELEERIE